MSYVTIVSVVFLHVLLAQCRLIPIVKVGYRSCELSCRHSILSSCAECVCAGLSCCCRVAVSNNHCFAPGNAVLMTSWSFFIKNMFTSIKASMQYNGSDVACILSCSCSTIPELYRSINETLGCFLLGGCEHYENLTYVVHLQTCLLRFAHGNHRLSL